MSATSLEPVHTKKLRLPIDGLILYLANKLAMLSGRREKEIERFLKFACVGALGAVIDLGTSFVLLRTVLDPKDAIHYNLAATTSFVAAVLSNFFWNRYWTYPDSRSRSVRRQLFLFFIVSVSGWLGRTIWINLSKPFFSDQATNLVHIIHVPIDDTTAALIGGMVAILLGIFVVMIWNFFVNRRVTYNDVDSVQSA
jgi:putative flippase GtrA